MYSTHYLWYLIRIIDDQESNLVDLIKYFTKTYTFQTNKELKVDMNAEGRRIILDYIKIYKDNCETKGVKKI